METDKLPDWREYNFDDGALEYEDKCRLVRQMAEDLGIGELTDDEADTLIDQLAWSEFFGQFDIQPTATVAQAAATLGVSTSTIRRRIGRGELKASKNARGRYILSGLEQVRPDPIRDLRLAAQRFWWLLAEAADLLRAGFPSSAFVRAWTAWEVLARDALLPRLFRGLAPMLDDDLVSNLLSTRSNKYKELLTLMWARWGVRVEFNSSYRRGCDLRNRIVHRGEATDSETAREKIRDLADFGERLLGQLVELEYKPSRRPKDGWPAGTAFSDLGAPGVGDISARLEGDDKVWCSLTDDGPDEARHRRFFRIDFRAVADRDRASRKSR